MVGNRHPVPAAIIPSKFGLVESLHENNMHDFPGLDVWLATFNVPVADHIRVRTGLMLPALHFHITAIANRNGVEMNSIRTSGREDKSCRPVVGVLCVVDHDTNVTYQAVLKGYYTPWNYGVRHVLSRPVDKCLFNSLVVHEMQYLLALAKLCRL